MSSKNCFLIEIDALEGQRCNERSGPTCAEGLQCIGKIQQVDGQGTCRNSSNLLNIK